MAIRRRQRISQENLERLVRAFNDPGQDYLAVEGILNDELQERQPEIPFVNLGQLQSFG